MPERIRAIIADDEPPARERIRDLLEREPDIDVVAECADGISAVEAIERLEPDLLFLDVQMPELDGFDVLERSLRPSEQQLVALLKKRESGS